MSTKASIFALALKEMEQSGNSTYGPIAFNKYLEHAGLTVTDKAPKYIAPDTLSTLDSGLRSAKFMIFRLGAEAGSRNTSFALAPVKSTWHDYFLLDEEIFETAVPEVFIPIATYRQLFIFTLLPHLSETGAINFAIASGLLSKALHLDPDELPYAPATGSLRASFQFRPHSSLEQVIWTHTHGQVQIDGLLSAARDNKQTVFVIEGKVGDSFGSLAKHKLLYSALAISPKIPANLEIVPIYLRICKSEEHLQFYMAECHPIDRKNTMAVDWLVPKHVGCWNIRGF